MKKLSEIKNWSVELEREITSNWREKELFEFNPKTKKKIYSIDTPPPYINTPIHMGHAVTYCFMDFFARYRRMKGYEVLFPLGLDRNGLPIEMAAEKKFKVSPFEVGRERFIEYCNKLLSESSVESIDSFSRLGISFSSYKFGDKIGNVYNTDSPEYRAITQYTFVELYKKGLIYEDSRINNWDTKLQTTIADSEIDYEDVESSFNYIRWKVKETGEDIVIGTTRPELICTCGMVIFNPKDERYLHLEGKTAISPVFGKEVPIRSHPLAQIEKGTGIVMMCSAGDLSDIQFFREMGLKPVIAINADGRMNENAGVLKGLKVREARQKIIQILIEKNLLERQERIKHRTPISERSKTEVEFIEMSEFYLKQIDFKEDIKRISDEINFYPPRSKKILFDWIDSISIDWPISRRRYYATPIPLWYSGNYVVVPKKGVYVEPWRESPRDDFEVLDKNSKKVLGQVRDFKGVKWQGETRVFDTWFDSSISEFNIIKYTIDEEFFKRAYPVSLRPQGKEIVRTWLYYTLLRGYLETGKACFRDVWIHQHILDEKGFKMSKSLGNVIDPKDILNEYGAECLRLWASTEGDLSKTDFMCSKEKIRSEGKTINKILNVAKFVFLFERPKKVSNLMDLDKLFIDYIDGLTKKVDERYEAYDFNYPAQELRKFLWDLFASNYIEIVKNRAYNQEGNFTKEESDSAKYTLYYLLERFLILMYPIIPQVTSVILSEMGIDVFKANWPTERKVNFEEKEELIRKVCEFNSYVWKEKKQRGISLREGIAGVEIPKELLIFEKDLRAAHRI